MMDGGRAFRLRKKRSLMEETAKGATCLLSNLLVINSEHSDRPKQRKKRWVKLKWLITSIPREGPNAPDKLKVRRK
jgi:hypothetical protein